MGGGPKTTQTQQQQTTQIGNQQQIQQGTSTQGSTSTQTTTPNLPDWYNTYLQGVPGQFGGLLGQLGGMANTPLFGDAQVANYQNQMNQQFGEASNALNEQLAKSGALNSTRAAIGQSALDIGKAQNIGNFMAQIPQQNFAARSSALGQYGNVLANAANFRFPFGSTTTGTTANQQGYTNTGLETNQNLTNSQGSSTTQQSGGLLQSLLGGLVGGLSSALTGGIGGMLNGTGFGAGAGSALGAAPPPAPIQDNPTYSPNFPMGPTQPFTGAYPQMPAGPTYPWSQGGAGMPPGFGALGTPYGVPIG